MRARYAVCGQDWGVCPQSHGRYEIKSFTKLDEAKKFVVECEAKLKVRSHQGAVTDTIFILPIRYDRRCASCNCENIRAVVKHRGVSNHYPKYAIWDLILTCGHTVKNVRVPWRREDRRVESASCPEYKCSECPPTPCKGHVDWQAQVETIK